MGAPTALLGANVAISVLIVGSPAWAQRAGENAVTEAEDAFGASVGNESIGLYSSQDIRGFSAIEAGNARIDGLYFDQKAPPTARIRLGSTIRVGPSAQSYPFPAPTGVVDYRLREARDRRIISVIAGTGTHWGPYVEVDALLPLTGTLGLAAGIGVQRDERLDGSAADFRSYGATLTWQPTPALKVRPFFGRFDSADDEAAPTIFTAGAFLPPEVERRRFYGQDWADTRGYAQNYGVSVRWRPEGSWSVDAGLFNSTSAQARAFSLFFNNTTRDGLGNPLIIARRDQHTASTSGEVRLSYAFSEGPRTHVLRLAGRGRDVLARYGGAATVALPAQRIGEPSPLAEPALSFTPLSRDQIRQWSGGLVYEGRWQGVGEASLGLQRVDYRKTVETPGRAPSVRQDQPWLVNATAAIEVSDGLTLYGGFTQGLEESGFAPDNAANRGEVLPALRTRQVDAGVRFRLAPDIRLIAGVFEVEKPYFNLDLGDNVFRELGVTRHRGLELSVAGTLGERLNFVGGAILLDPRVSGEAVDDGRIGDRPIAKIPLTILASADYRVAAIDGLSLDASVTHFGRRTANLANTLETEPQTTINLGARYRFELGDTPAVLRVQIVNLTDQFAWNVTRSGGFVPNQGRSITASLAADFIR